MTTITAFKPPPNNAFSFQPTLDGNSCNALVFWNAVGQRWYISITLPDGTQLFNVPLIGSLAAINLQSLTWANGQAQAVTVQPHGYKFLNTIDLTIAGCDPLTYNGTFPCFIDSPTTFRYPIAGNPAGNVNDEGVDTALQLGQVSFDINLGAGFLVASTLVYREAAQVFEVSP